MRVQMTPEMQRAAVDAVQELHPELKLNDALIDIVEGIRHHPRFKSIQGLGLVGAKEVLGAIILQVLLRRRR